MLAKREAENPESLYFYRSGKTMGKQGINIKWERVGLFARFHPLVYRLSFIPTKLKLTNQVKVFQCILKDGTSFGIICNYRTKPHFEEGNLRHLPYFLPCLTRSIGFSLQKSW